MQQYHVFGAIGTYSVTSGWQRQRDHIEQKHKIYVTVLIDCNCHLCVGGLIEWDGAHSRTTFLSWLWLWERASQRAPADPKPSPFNYHHSSGPNRGPLSRPPRPLLSVESHCDDQGAWDHTYLHTPSKQPSEIDWHIHQSTGGQESDLLLYVCVLLPDKCTICHALLLRPTYKK
jgi:hypothetical protein